MFGRKYSSNYYTYYMTMTTSEIMTTFTTLDIPHGMFWVINPYQVSDSICKTYQV